MNKASELIKWFNNHTFALGILRKEQEVRNQKPLALISTCLTRWTTHFLAANRLNTLKQSMCACVNYRREELITAGGEKEEQKDAAKQVITFIEDGTFWATLSE